MAQAEDRRRRQTVGVLRRLDNLYTAGRWARGRHFGDDGGYCMNGAIVSSTRWTVPGVDREVRRELCREMPLAGRALAVVVGRRAALAMYNDYVGRERGVRRLVKSALARLDDYEPFDIRDVLGVPQARPARDADPIVFTSRRLPERSGR